MTTIENKEIEESWVKQDWVYIKTALILAIFTAIQDRFKVPILTDIHEPYQAKIFAGVCDFLQLVQF